MNIGGNVTIPAKSIYFSTSSAINGLDGAPVTLRIGGTASNTTVGVRTYQGQYYYFIPAASVPGGASVEYKLSSDSNYTTYGTVSW